MNSTAAGGNGTIYADHHTLYSTKFYNKSSINNSNTLNTLNLNEINAFLGVDGDYYHGGGGMNIAFSSTTNSNTNINATTSNTNINFGNNTNIYNVMASSLSCASSVFPNYHLDGDENNFINKHQFDFDPFELYWNNSKYFV